jgi:Mycothiol maleylpyruvate isomerase N-terminal domain
MATGAELIRVAWAPLIELADSIDEDHGWIPTHLPGWTARDLLLHLSGDAQRALVALFTPASDRPGEASDIDEVDYWRPWTPGTEDAQTSLRSTRAIASQWVSVRGPAELFAMTARAATRAADAADPKARIVTRGGTLTIDALLRTIAVEAAVHHLDLEPLLPGRPEQVVLSEVRRLFEALLGQDVPASWDDVRWIRVGTGRVAPNATEIRHLGSRIDSLPLFG